jgi:GNAT superfamily N-acetyltransferase
MAGSIAYRAAEPADFDAIADVWRESALASEGARSSLPSLAELRSRVDHEIAAGWAVTVALDGQEIIGFLALKPALAALDQLFILPTHQGRGIGRDLIERAKQAMPGGFTLRTASANQKARQFYSASGLALLEEGFHPRTGIPVCYYGWSIQG